MKRHEVEELIDQKLAALGITACEPHHHHHYKATFGELEVCERFYWGGKEHVKLPEIQSGQCSPFLSTKLSQRQSGAYQGHVNCIQVGTCQLSGMGPLVEVERIECERIAA